MDIRTTPRFRPWYTLACGRDDRTRHLSTCLPQCLDIERICSDLGLQFELEMELLILKIWFKVLPCDFAIERSHLDVSIRWSANSELQGFAPFGGALRLHSK
ncbi:hypothetical protein AcW1_007994 [Taiwanofungus camphoratus]|nr:hypothetical protein AcW1_007994 [Antrodia cinnamomea]